MSHKTKVLNHYRPVTVWLIRESAYINLYHVSKSLLTAVLLTN